MLRAVVGAVGPVLARVPAALLLRDPAAGARAFDRALEAIPRESEGRVRGARTPSARIHQCAVEMSAFFRRVRQHLSRMLAGFVALALLRRAARGRWADEVRGAVAPETGHWLPDENPGFVSQQLLTFFSDRTVGAAAGKGDKKP